MIHKIVFQLSDSVEEGDKVVKTAIDNFGRLGELCTFRLTDVDQN